MKLVALISLLTTAAFAECKKNDWDGDFYLQFADSQNETHTISFHEKKNCDEKYQKVVEGKLPLKICACDSHSNWSAAFISLGSLSPEHREYTLYCYDINTAGEVKKTEIDTWGWDKREINLQKCEQERGRAETTNLIRIRQIP